MYENSQKSTQTNKLAYLNSALGKKCASDQYLLERQKMTSLGWIFTERRNVEAELFRQHNAKVVCPLPKLIRSGNRRMGKNSQGMNADLRHVQINSTAPRSKVDLNMRRSTGECEFPAVPSAYAPLATKSEKNVHFENDSQPKESRDKIMVKSPLLPPLETPVKQADIGGEVSDHYVRLFNSSNAMATYKRLQWKVHESLVHGITARNSEAAVESTMNLRRRRQQRQVHEDERAAAAAKRESKNAIVEQKTLAHNNDAHKWKTNKSPGVETASVWRNRGHVIPMGQGPGELRATKAAHRILDGKALSLWQDEPTARLQTKSKLVRQHERRRNNKLNRSKNEQILENERVTRKVDAYFRKY